MLFVWSNLIVFEMANQRNAGDEDALNKPHRPIPSGRLQSSGMRRIFLLAVPLVLLISWSLHTLHESVVSIALTWMYNDLGGGADNFIVRNVIIVTAFAVYNIGALKVIIWNEIDVPSASGYD